MRISHQYRIPVVEDAAHALGSKYQQKFVGTFGDFGTFSFNNNKIVSGLGGGVLYARIKSYVERGKYLPPRPKQRNHTITTTIWVLTIASAA